MDNLNNEQIITNMWKRQSRSGLQGVVQWLDQGKCSPLLAEYTYHLTLVSFFCCQTSLIAPVQAVQQIKSFCHRSLTETQVTGNKCDIGGKLPAKVFHKAGIPGQQTCYSELTDEILMKPYLYWVQGDEKSEAREMLRLASLGRQGSDTQHKKFFCSVWLPNTSKKAP